MPLSLGPLKINLNDKLRTGFRVKYNLLVDKVIKDGQAYTSGIKLITHDGTEIEIDITEFFYTKEAIDEMFFIDYATEEEAGKIRIATIEEVLDGEDDTTVVTPYKLFQMLNGISGRYVTAGEDLVAGDYVYLTLPEEEEEPDPEEEPDLYPTMVAFKAIATSRATMAMGFVEEDALEGDESAIKFSSNVNTYHTDLIPGKYYYLSDEDPGVLIPSPPFSAGSVTQVVGYAISNLEMMVEIDKPEINDTTPYDTDFPDLYFFVGEESTESIYLPDYILEAYEDTVFRYEYVDLPEWITDHVVVFDNASLTGKPTEVGKWTSYLEAIDEDGKVFKQPLIIYAIEKSVPDTVLLDTTTQPGEEVGAIPGAWPIPDRWNPLTTIDIQHDEISIQIVGGGPDGLSVNEKYTEPLLDPVESGEYLGDPYNGGFVSLPGVYRMIVLAYYKKRIVVEATIIFTLYDEEYLGKAKIELYDSVTDTLIGEVNPDGSSTFIKPANGFDLKFTIDGNSHSEATLSLLSADEVMKERKIGPITPVEDAEYFLYNAEAPIQPSGDYQASLTMKLSGTQNYERVTPFSILEEEVKPKGGLILVRMLPNTINHEVIGELPKSGGEFDLPDLPGWNTLSEYEGEEIDFEEWFNFEKRNGSLFEFDSSLYTGKPQAISYTKPVKKSSLRTFWNKGSGDINSIHKFPSSFRQIVRRKVGGINGKVVDIQMADFSFREPLSPADYSGLRFLIDDAAGLTLIDTNMPKTGREYQIPVAPARWTTSVRSFGGASFNRVRIKLRKFIGGSFVTLHQSGIDYLYDINLGGSFTELDNDQATLLTALIGAGELRYALDPSNVQQVIDEAGRYEVSYLGYLNTTLVGTLTSDFTLIDPDEEEPPIEECCGSGMFVVYAGEGLSEVVDDRLKTLNVEYDNIGIGINGANQLYIKAVDFALLGEFMPRTILGNMNVIAGNAYMVSVINNMSLATNSNLADALTSKQYIDSALTGAITGTVGYLPKFGTTTSLTNSIAREVTGTVFVDGFLVVGATTNERLRISSDAANLYVNFADSSLTSRFAIHSQATKLGFEISGTEVFRINQSTADVTFIKAITIGGAPAPLNVTSQLLCTNLNADLLDGQHGAYYLSRANHTGTQLASTISDFSTATLAVALTGLSIVAGSPITASDTILSAFGKLQGQVNTNAASVSGTAGQLAYFVTSSTIGNSIAKQASGTLTIEGFAVVGTTANEKVRIAMDTANSYVQFSDASLVSRFALHSQPTKLGFEVAGTEAFRINQSTIDVTFVKAITISATTTAPLVVSSTILVTSLNADLLDGQHGIYYLDRANHTGTQLASTISNFSATVLATALTGLSIVTGSAITASDTILSAFGKLQGQVNTNASAVSGTAGQLAYFVTGSTIGSSIAKQASGTMTVEGFLVVGASANEKVRIAMDTANSYIQFSDSALVSRFALHAQPTKLGFEVAGTEVFRINQSTADTTFIKAINISATLTSPLVVASTILVTNLNSDLLDDQHGVYYLDRANHTGSQAISTVTGLQTALDAKLTGTGTANRFVVWTGTSTVASSNLFYNGGNVGVGVNPGYQFEVAGSIRYSNQLSSTVATGTAPLDVTSTTLCINLNADLLDGQHGSYYLSRANHTGSQAISTVTGLQTALDAKPAGSGTANYFALWTGTNTLGAGTLQYNGGNVGVGMNPGYQFDVNGSIRYSNQLASSVATGTAPLDVTSTSLCVNLNADLLDGNHASAFALASHTHTSSQITDFTSAVRGSISGSGGISYNSSTGVISYTGGTGISGSGTSGVIAKWTGSGSIGNSTITDTGTEINFANTRSLGVEGPAAMRDYLHVWGYCNMGTSSNHGTLLIHQANSGTINAAAALEIRSTTKGVLFPMMTTTQRRAISSPPVGLIVYQTDSSGAGSSQGLYKHLGSNVWSNEDGSYVGA